VGAQGFRGSAWRPGSRSSALVQLALFQSGEVVGVACEVAVLSHHHPGVAGLDQAKTEQFSQRVARAEQAGIALSAQQIAQIVSGQFVGGLESFDQPLLFAFIQRRELHKRFQLSQGLLVSAEARLPSDVCRHPFWRAAAITSGLLGGFSIEHITWKPLCLR
jgi:hypothetical protein